MKRIFMLLVLLALGGSAEAQSLTDIFKKFLSAISMEESVPETPKNPASMAGVWIYQEPAITYTGNDLLASLAIATLRDQFAPYYTKAGFKPGETAITMLSNGEVHAEISKHKIDGTYSYRQSSGSLTFTGTVGGASRTFTSTVSPEADGTVIVLFDAQKMLDLACEISSSVAKDSRVQQIAAILKEYPGVMFGAKLRKR